MKTICGCCEPGSPPTPLTVENRPALSAIAYRIGTYSSFRQAMLEGIARAPELAALTTRRSDDYAITVLELWAAVADVLTFYQERYANEAFLRTAAFRDSIMRLADTIGYRLRPGVAAETWIAFTLDKGKTLKIAAGQKVQSVPPAGEQPRVFETLADITADAAWNRLRIFPPSAARTPLQKNSTGERLDRVTGPAVAAALAPGAAVVLFNDGTTDPVEEKKIRTLANVDDRVALRWDLPVKSGAWNASTRVFRYRRTFKWFGHNAPAQYVVPSAPASAPHRITWSLTNLGSLVIAAGTTIQLDGKYENLGAGQKLLIADSATGGYKTLVTIEKVRQVNAAFGPLADTVTELTVKRVGSGVTQVPEITSRQKVVVYELEGDAISFWQEYYQSNITGDTLYLPGVARQDPERGLGVEVGRTISRDAFAAGAVICLREVEKGRRVLLADAKAAPVPATLRETPTVVPANAGEGQFCHLVLKVSLTGSLSLETASAMLLGNVAEASHGETVSHETVGSGDASAVFQSLTLKKAPLTWLSGTKGLSSTLDLRVDGIRWKQVAQLYGQAADASVFETRTEDDGITTLQFGDGRNGATLPTGSNNVTATYRIGSGLAGRVAAGSLTTLLSRPTGLSAASNPLAAEGGSDAETLDEARQNAPRTVRTFGRIVSLADFEDEVTASGEIAKALATWVWDGLDRSIYLTIAGQAGATFSEQARRDLGASLNRLRDPNHRLRIANYQKINIEFRAGVAVDAAYDRDTVLAAAREAVLDALSFDNLRLGQSIHLSDLYRVLQDVPGVVYVDVDRLMFKQPAWMPLLLFLILLWLRGVQFLPGFVPAPVQAHLRIFSARPAPFVTGAILAAELAAVESPTQDVTIEPREV